MLDRVNALSKDRWPRDGLDQVTTCPVCQSDMRDVLYEALSDRVMFAAPGKWTLWECQRCGSAYLDPRPSIETIGLAYRNYYTHSAPGGPAAFPQIPLGGLRLALRNGYLNGRYGYGLSPAHWVGGPLAYLFPLRRMTQDSWIRHLAMVSDHPHLLDIGCGNGAFLERMRLVGWSVQGVDPDPYAVKMGQEAGLTIHEGTLDTVDLKENHFDAVTMSHVLEHLHDPIGTLQACFRLLRPGGVLWIATPNLISLGHRYYGDSWIGLDPPRHLCIFTPESLQLALRTAGFGDISKSKFVPKASWMFAPSAAIANGTAPYDDTDAPPAALRAKASFADLRAWLRPELGEELVVLVRKPEGKKD